MTKHYSSLLALALIFSAFGFGTAHASISSVTSSLTAGTGATVSGGASNSASGNVSASNSGTGSVQTGASANVNTSGTASSGNTGSGATNSNVSSNTSGSNNGSVSGNTQNAANVMSSFSLTRSDLTSNTQDQTTNSANGTVWDSTTGNGSTSASASSNDTFKSYVMSVMRNDPNLSTVQSNDTGMDITYREPAHFLGFIPAHMNAKIHVASDGTVSVGYPWYHFFMSSDRSGSDLQTALSASLSAAANANGTGTTAMDGSSTNAQGTTTTATNSTAGIRTTWARMFDQIESTLRGNVQASANSSAQSTGY